MEVLMKKNILFVCTNNAGRSQIAEAVFRRLYGKSFEVQSAGVDPWEVIHPVGRALMNKNGYSMKGHKPKHVETIDFGLIDIVVTIGDPAEEGTRKSREGKGHVHWDLGDPARADGTSDSESVFIETKRRIENKIKVLGKTLANLQAMDEFFWKPAICTCVFRGDQADAVFDPVRHVSLLAKKGFKLIELSCYIPRRDFDWRNKHKVDELLSVCADNGIDIWSAHPPENEVLLGTDENARQKHFDMLKEFADFCNQIGAAYMPIHLWSTTRSLEQIKADSLWNSIPAELEKLCLTSNVTLCVETLRNNVSMISNGNLLDMLKERNSCLGLLMDTGHAHISGDLHDVTLRAESFIKSLHLHDNDSVDDTHQIPDAKTGTIDWNRFAANLKHIRYTGPILYEIAFIPYNELDKALTKTIEHYQRFFCAHDLLSY